ncbi:MAG TPA: phage holin family protein [Stellaceae bacterium]|jgi:hypothetical protein|nr:phage holin family protein [Stellaceae bacterium]
MADRDAASAHEPGLAALLAQLFHDAETLLLQQLALLRAELGENAGRLVLGALVLAAGIAVALIGGLALVAALILLLGRIMPLWAASALVGAVIAAAGAVLVFYGRRLIARASVMPRQSWQALRETGDWLRQELT